MAHINESSLWPSASAALKRYQLACKKHGSRSPEAKALAEKVVDCMNAAAADTGHAEMLTMKLMGY